MCVCVCVCVCVPVGKCTCLHQCPGYMGVPRCVCRPHVCACARPVGCRHTTHVCVDTQFSQRRRQAQLGPHASSLGGGPVGSGSPGADTPPAEGPGSPDSSEWPLSSCTPGAWISWLRDGEQGPRVCILVNGHAEKAVAPHSSTLARKIPRMEEPGRLQSMES